MLVGYAHVSTNEENWIQEHLLEQEFSYYMKVAFIGYENSGKKSIFKILTGQDITSSGKKIIDSQLIIRDERINQLGEEKRGDKEQGNHQN